MGEIAEMMLEGVLCQICGEYLGEGDGFPVTCESCGGSEPIDDDQAASIRRKGPRKMKCPMCERHFRSEQAVRDHLRDKHDAKAKKETAL